MQPKYTQSANIDPAKATFGEKSAGVLALQKSLNQQNAGKAGWVPLKEDALYGPLTQAGTQFKAPVVTTTPATGSNPNNASGSSTAARSNITAIGNDISGLESTSQANRKLLLDRLGINEANLKQDISGIMRDYEQAAKIQEKRQAKDYAGTSTKLVTSGGGFLGYTGSQEGVLQNLKSTFEEEKGALMAKRDNAIQAARSAFDDKQFQLASSLVKEARDTENEIYSRQKDFAENSLALARENRAQTEFDMGLADKKLKAYADIASNNEELSLDNNIVREIDNQFGVPGYTKQYLEIARSTALGKTIENDIKLKNSIQTLINKTPMGKKIVLPDGSVYVGLKKEGTGTSAGMISSSIASQLGIPSLAGKDESDIILSLSLENPPTWYKEYYKISNPTVYTQLTPEQLKTDWKIFTSQPDIEAYKNSAVVTKRISESQNQFKPSTSSDNDILDEE